ncbi:hypothetical protein M8756_19235, partial [Lutimaribacter sp. EGI FJ00015]|nr:hypothetical protein [Lutimaribacter sp. EGI FJ00015]
LSQQKIARACTSSFPEIDGHFVGQLAQIKSTLSWAKRVPKIGSNEAFSFLSYLPRACCHAAADGKPRNTAFCHLMNYS